MIRINKNTKAFAMILVVMVVMNSFAFAVDGNKELDIRISNTQVELSNSNFDISVDWEVDYSNINEVSAGDYFKIQLPDLIDYSSLDTLDNGDNGVTSRHEGNGLYVFTVTDAYNGYDNISGYFNISRSLKTAVTSDIEFVEVIINSNSVNIPVDNNVDDSPTVGSGNHFEKIAYPISKDDDGYFIKWVVFVGSEDVRYIGEWLVDTLGEGLELLEDSFEARALDRFGNPAHVYIDRPIITDNGFELYIRNTDGAKIEIMYITRLTRNLDEYSNKASISNTSTGHTVDWGVSSGDSGVVRPPIESTPMIPLEPSIPVEKDDEEIPLTPLEPSIPIIPEEEDISTPLTPLVPSTPIEEDVPLTPLMPSVPIISEENEIVIPIIPIIPEEEEVEEEDVEDIDDVDDVEDIEEIEEVESNEVAETIEDTIKEVDTEVNTNIESKGSIENEVATDKLPNTGTKENLAGLGFGMLVIGLLLYLSENKK